MASNVFSVNVYQINQLAPTPLAQVTAIGLPTTGVIARNVINSPTRSLSTGVNVYTEITVLATGTKYYVSSTYATIISAIG
mgnify:CR=1 FL=1